VHGVQGVGKVGVHGVKAVGSGAGSVGKGAFGLVTGRGHRKASSSGLPAVEDEALALEGYPAVPPLPEGVAPAAYSSELAAAANANNIMAMGGAEVTADTQSIMSSATGTPVSAGSCHLARATAEERESGLTRLAQCAHTHRASDARAFTIPSRAGTRSEGSAA
jgi:hypothetical protein